MRKLLFLVFTVCWILFSFGNSFAEEKHLCHNSIKTFEICTTDSTFWHVAEPESLRLRWGRYDGTNSPVKKDSLLIDCTGAGDIPYKLIKEGAYAVRINASVDGTDSSYACWAHAIAYTGGVTGVKTWTWYVGDCKEDSLYVLVQAEAETLKTANEDSDSLTLFPFEKLGSLVESFDDTSDFTLGGNGDHYWVQHTKGYGLREGKGSIEMITTDDDSCYMYRAFGGASDLGSWRFVDIETISFWLCLNVDALGVTAGGDYDLDLDKFHFMLTKSGGTPDTWTGSYRIVLGDSSLSSGWQHIIFHRSQLEVHGTITSSDTIGGIFFSIKTQTAGDSLGVIFEDLRFNEKNTPVVMVTFDDGHESIYTMGYEYMHNQISPPLPGTVFLQGNVINTASSLTHTMLRTMHDGGWIIGNHTLTHPDLPLSAPTQVRHELEYTSRIIEDTLQAGPLSLETNAEAFFGAYPYGRYDEEVIDVVRGCGFLLFRGILEGRRIQGHLEYPGGDEWFKLKSHYLHSDHDTTTKMNAYIDTCIMRGGLLLLMFHSLRDDGGDVGHQFDTSTFNPVMRYLAAKRDSGYCEVLDFNQYLDKFHDSRHYALRTYKIAKMLSDASGGFENCYERLFPEDGTPSKDSAWIINPALGPDSVVFKFYYQEYDSTYYDRSIHIRVRPESKREFIK